MARFLTPICVFLVCNGGDHGIGIGIIYHEGNYVHLVIFLREKITWGRGESCSPPRKLRVNMRKQIKQKTSTCRYYTRNSINH